jgi:hypothetical protein
MAKKSNSRSPGQVTIQYPLHDANQVPATFSATGTGSPDNTCVTGVLSDGNDPPNTFQSNPAFSPIQLGSWTLNFQNIPLGAYTLGVQQAGDNGGADAITITITGTLTIPVVALPPIPAAVGGVLTVTAVVTDSISGAFDSSLLYSAVIASNKPVHAEPPFRVRPNAKTGNITFTFNVNGMQKGNHTVTVYPVKDRGKGKRAVVKV